MGPSVFVGEHVKVMDNEFPYAFTPDVLHKVIWSATELSIDEYRNHLKKHFSDDEYDIVMFVNPPQLKSVPRCSSRTCIYAKKKNGRKSRAL